MARSDCILDTEEYPKKSGIKIRLKDNATMGQRFGASYMVTIPTKVSGKGRIRRQFRTLEEARKYADEQYKGFKKEGAAYFKLTTQERHEIGAVVPRLRKKGITIMEAVEYALARLRPEGGEKLIGEVIADLQASKTKRHDAGDLAFRSWRDFNNRSDRIAEYFEGQYIHGIDVNQIKDWVTGIEGSDRTRRNYLRIASEIFRYARQKRYLMENPMDDLADVDRKEIHGRLIQGGDIEALRVDQAEDLIHHTKDNNSEFLAVITLGLFCGIRSEELQKLRWDRVNLERGEVTIDADIAKKRRIRIVTIPGNAKEWLMLCPNRKGRIAPEKGRLFERRFMQLRLSAGFADKDGNSNWPHNGMRHSFGSYHYALHDDSNLTAKELGHKADDQILFDHYRSLASKEQGRAYFEIRPGQRKGKVIRLKEVGA